MKPTPLKALPIHSTWNSETIVKSMKALNDWVPRGWTFDGVQFAMRESSKRPSMAFVFFTRMGLIAEVQPPRASVPRPVVLSDAYDRLRQLAEGGDES